MSLDSSITDKMLEIRIKTFYFLVIELQYP